MTEPAEEQPDPRTIARPEPMPGGGRQDESSPFDMKTKQQWIGIGAHGCICKAAYKISCPIHGFSTTGTPLSRGVTSAERTKHHEQTQSKRS